jgi:predicted exporter
MRVSRQWLWLLFIPLVWAGLSRLHVKTDVLDLLPAEEPVVEGLKLYQQYFSTGRELIITIRSSSATNSEWVAKEISARLRQESALVAHVWWQPPWTEFPKEIGESLAWVRMNEPANVFGDLTNRLSANQMKAVLANTRDMLATSLSPMDLALGGFDPYGLVKLPKSLGLEDDTFRNGDAMFASKDGLFHVVYVEAKPDLSDYRSCIQWRDSVTACVDGLRQTHPEWDDAVIRYTGRPAFEAEIAGSMQRDIQGSVIGTALIIALLFWLAHRRWLPMLWLLVLLGLILVATLAIGSLALGAVNVISMGFAAILLGLAVDYALVHYQEALSHPHAAICQIRRAIAPSILWAAATTISAFLVLNLGGIPGLAQLGSLVAIGVALSAVVMVAAYLPPLFRDRKHLKDAGLQPEPLEKITTTGKQQRGVFALTALIVLVGFICVTTRPPRLDRSADALRPTHSEASDVLKEMQTALELGEDPLWVIVRGNSEKDILELLGKTTQSLDEAQKKQAIRNYLLPSAFWPNEESWLSNQAAASLISGRAEALRNAAIQEGFMADSLELTGEMLQSFGRFGAGSGIVWPTNSVSQWIVNRFVARETNGWFVMGLVYPGTNQADMKSSSILPGITDKRVLVTGWQLLGNRMIERVQGNMRVVVLLMAMVLFASLSMAFRSIREVALGIGVMLLSGLCLLTVMALAGWSWNLINLMALPLILGTGVDYCIFMQLALRRSHGDQAMARRSVGRALILCGATAVAGFGSLAWSGNAGLSSFGKVCAIGVSANMLISVFLLPAWWMAAVGKRYTEKKSGIA